MKQYALDFKQLIPIKDVFLLQIVLPINAEKNTKLVNFIMIMRLVKTEVVVKILFFLKKIENVYIFLKKINAQEEKFMNIVKNMEEVIKKYVSLLFPQKHILIVFQTKILNAKKENFFVQKSLMKKIVFIMPRQVVTIKDVLIMELKLLINVMKNI